MCLISLLNIQALKKQFVLLITLFFISIAAIAQDYTVRGFVYNDEDGEALAFVKVLLKAKDASDDAPVIGATTDMDGLFQFSKVKAGDYIVEIRSTDHDIVEDFLVLEQKMMLFQLLLSHLVW